MSRRRARVERMIDDTDCNASDGTAAIDPRLCMRCPGEASTEDRHCTCEQGCNGGTSASTITSEVATRMPGACSSAMCERVNAAERLWTPRALCYEYAPRGAARHRFEESVKLSETENPHVSSVPALRFLDSWLLLPAEPPPASTRVPDVSHDERR